MLSAAAYAGMFVFGIVMALLGAILPLVSQKIDLPLGQAGSLFFAMNLTMLATMLGLGPLMDRFGKKLPLAAGPLLVGIALWGFATAAAYPGLVLAAILLGAGGGALNGGANTLISDLHSDPRRRNAALNLLGMFLGFGALFVPFLIGSLIGAVGLAPILFGAALLAALPGLLAAVLRFPPPKHSEGVAFSEIGRLARHPLVLLFAFLLFFQSGNEFIMGGFISTYLTRELGISIAGASYLLAAYWAALLAARVVSARLLLRVSGSKVVLASAVIAAAGVLLLVAASQTWTAALALLVVGAGFSPIFPTTLGLAGSAFESYSGTVFGILFAVALTGGMSLPWAVGQSAEAWGLRTALCLAAANAGMIALLQTAITRVGRNARTAPSNSRLP